MRGAVQVTTDSTQVVANGLGWTFAYIYNNSDATIYLQWTAENDALTVNNGIPLASGGTLRIPAFNSDQRSGIKAIHGGAGNKEVRYVVE